MIIAFGAIAVALLVVIILFMTYFQILRDIASFSYPNAKYRAIGTPFINRHELAPLLESRGPMEAVQYTAPFGFEFTSQTGEFDIERFERELDSNHIKIINNAMHAAPEGARPFFKAFSLEFDAAQVKKLFIEKSGKGLKPLAQSDLVATSLLKKPLLTEMMDAKSVEEIVGLLHDTPFHATLSKAVAERKTDPVYLEHLMDHVVVGALRSSIYLSDSNLSTPLKRFMGMYADILNIKSILRAKSLGFGKEQISAVTVEGGRELAPWKLEQMSEAKGVAEVLGELEGTSYMEIVKGMLAASRHTVDPYTVEHALDMELLKRTCEISSQNMLSVGVGLKLVVAKQFEIRNLRAIVRGLNAGMKKETIESLLIVEASA